MQFPQSTRLLTCYLYMNKCIDSFKEQKNSFSYKLRINGEVLFKRQNFAYFEETLGKRLQRIAPSFFDPEGMPTRADFEAFCTLLSDVIVSAFAMGNLKEESLKPVLNFLLSLLTERLTHCLRRSGPCLFTSRLCLDVAAKVKRLTAEFNLKDLRVDITFKFLLLGHKKLIFNAINDKITVAFGRLVSEPMPDAKVRPAFHNLFSEFETAVIEYFDEFSISHDFVCPASAILDGLRKILYMMYHTVAILLEKGTLELNIEECLFVLDEAAKFCKTVERIIAEQIVKFKHSKPVSGKLLNFKPLVVGTNRHILSTLDAKLCKCVIKRLGNLQLTDFSFMKLLTEQFGDVLEQLKRGSLVQQLKVSSMLLKHMAEEILVQIGKRLDKGKDRKLAAEILKDMEKFFTGQMDEIEGSCFVRFLDYYAKFQRSTNQETCETALAMMNTILGDQIAQRTLRAAIEFKDYQGLKFTSQQIRAAVDQLLKKEANCKAELERRQEYKRKIWYKLWTVIAVAKMYCLMQRCRRGQRTWQQRELKCPRECLRALEAKFESGAAKPFNRACLLSICTAEAQSAGADYSSKEASILAQLASCKPFKTVISLAGHCFTIQRVSEAESASPRLTAILFPGKVSSVELVTLSEPPFQVVFFRYPEGQRYIVQAEPQTEIADWHLDFSSTVGTYKRLILNERTLEVINQSSALIQTKFFKRWFLSSNYQIRETSYFGEADLVKFPHSAVHGFSLPKVQKTDENKVITKRKAIENFFSEEAIQLLKGEEKEAEAETEMETETEIEIEMETEAEAEGKQMTCEIRPGLRATFERRWHRNPPSPKRSTAGTKSKSASRMSFVKKFEIMLSKISEEEDLSERDFALPQLGQENPEFVQRYLHHFGPN